MEMTEIAGQTGPSGAVGSLWYVTNGKAVIGPVGTDLLLRGISSGRVPNDCYIAQPTWAVWRPLEQIREVRALYRKQEGAQDSVGKPLPDALPFAGIDDDDQLLKQALKLAVEQTHADVGLLHQDIEPHVGLVTTHAYGRGMKTALARVIPSYDALHEVLATADNANPDKIFRSPSEAQPWARSATRRLSTGGPVKAVAISSIKVVRGMNTVIELGHFRHSFRYEDAQALSAITSAVSLRLEQLAF